MSNTAKHALIAPSSCDRIGYCPASVLLSKDIPSETTVYAEEGTAAHRLAEIQLLSLFECRVPSEAEQAEMETIVAKHPDAPAHIKTYVDEVARIASGAFFTAAEMRLTLTPITGELDAFGTADCVVITGDTLHIIDLKYGAGVKVAAKENVQLCMYALAALAELDPDSLVYAVANVRLHIVQPRMDSTEHWDISRDLLERAFYPRIRKAIDRARYLVEHPADLEVGFPFLPAGGGEPLGDFAVPSDDICRFCRAKAACPALHKVTVDALEKDFEDIEDGGKAELTAQVREIPLPDTPENVAKAFAWLKPVRMWADAVEAAMHQQLSVSGEAHGYKLVAGCAGPRKWTEAAEAEEILRRALTVDKAYERKLISPATAEKLHKSGDIGPKYWSRLSRLINRAKGKPQIVPSSDERPALIPRLESDFEDLS